ncbi:hypothetical protein BDN72DRAFT_864677, partial [Pluteus cervinus]
MSSSTSTPLLPPSLVPTALWISDNHTTTVSRMVPSVVLRRPRLQENQLRLRPADSSTPTASTAGCLLDPTLYPLHHHQHRRLMMLWWFSTSPTPTMPSNDGFQPGSERFRGSAASVSKLWGSFWMPGIKFWGGIRLQPRPTAVTNSIHNQPPTSQNPINNHRHSHSKEPDNVCLCYHYHHRCQIKGFRPVHATSPKTCRWTTPTSSAVERRRYVQGFSCEVGALGGWGLSGCGRVKWQRKKGVDSPPRLASTRWSTHSADTLPERPSPSKRVHASLDRITSISFDLNITSLFTATSNDVDASTPFHLDHQYLRLLTAFWLVGDFDLTSKTVQRRLSLTFGRTRMRSLDALQPPTSFETLPTAPTLSDNGFKPGPEHLRESNHDVHQREAQPSHASFKYTRLSVFWDLQWFSWAREDDMDIVI